jgi:glycerol-3-phosphate dehydrogenase (NAD(P)+)
MLVMNHESVVIGGGSWGTGLACQLARKQKAVALIMKNEEIVHEILAKRTNSKYLGNIVIPENIFPSTDWRICLNAKNIFLALPSYALFQAILVLKSLDISSNINLVIATKGLSRDPVELISKRLEKSLPNKIAFIAGPNFAKEVAVGSLSSATIASTDQNLAKKIAELLSSEYFITSVTDDIITVQVAGVVKNIIAIQSGVYEAMNYGENARAMLISNGLNEIALIARELGGKPETLLSFGVIGDLALTCYSRTSRNTKFGFELAKQQNSWDFANNYPYLVEGKEGTKLITELVKPYNLKLPIIQSVINLLTPPG